MISLDQAFDPQPLVPLLHAQEAILTQKGPGTLIRRADLVSHGAITLYRSDIGAPSVGMTQAGHERVGLVIPVRWQEPCTVNGVMPHIGTLFLHGQGNCLYIAGKSRTTISVMTERAPLVKTVAALCGIDFEAVDCSFRVLRVGTTTGRVLRARLARIFHAVRRSDPRGLDASDYENESLELMIGIVLDSDPSFGIEPSRSIQASRIVRLAEERFDAAGCNPLSLSDLCAAAGVGKTTLYRAFASTVGVTPLAYFKKRRLTRARLQLLAADPGRGRVKRAALGAGLTELGRFSLEYRRLFGEAPSATLSGSSLA